ncbi:MAG: hypothetical protein ACKOEZ_14130, partial [Spartobacteria bacterium]
GDLDEACARPKLARLQAGGAHTGYFALKLDPLRPNAAFAHDPAISAGGILLALTSIFAACEKKTEESIGEKKTDDLAGYRKVEAPQIPVPEIKSPELDSGADGWTLPTGFRHVVGEGLNQTGALYHERTNPDDYFKAEQSVALLPNTQYRFSAWVKTENVQGADEGGATVCLEFRRGDRWLGGVYPAGAMGTKDWTRVEEAGTVPADADSCRLVLYMRKGLTGKAWFDDVTIVPMNRAIEAHLLRPSQYFLTTDGHFLLSWRLSENVREINQNAGLVTRIEVRAEGKMVKTLSFPCRDWSSSGDLGSLPAGPLTLTAQLLNPQTKTILHEQELAANCIDKASIPSTAVRIDSLGRTMVGDKPYLPVGLFLHGAEPEDIARIGDSPFNCVMPYGSLTMGFKGTEKKGVERTRELLDAFAAKNIKVIFSIKDLYDGYTHFQGAKCPTKWHGMTGNATAITTAVVEAFREHPSLLAWYIGDEKPLSFVPQVTARRKLLHRLDPWHPSWTVNYQYFDFSGYTGMVDVLGLDTYDIVKKTTNNMGVTEAGMDAAKEALASNGGGMQLWNAIQAHNIGLYNPAWNKDRETLLANSRAPSEEEMRSFSLLMAIKGTRGFIFYSYFDLLKPAVLPDFEQRWAELWRVGALMRELQPFL